MRPGGTRYRLVATLLFVAGLAGSSMAWADDHIRGVITGRGDAGAVIVQTDSGKLTVGMTDTTRVTRIDGIRAVMVSSADLIPGLRIKAEGGYDAPDRFVAKRVNFPREDFKVAAAIQGGVTPTDQRSLANERNIQQHAQELAGHQRELGEHGQQLTTQSGQIAANAQQIVATTGALAATNARIANLDDYTPLKSVTVYFKNGKAEVSKSDKAQLQALATQASGTNAYVIQVQAYASAVGPDPLNQKLSMERANAVTSILQQSGVPLTNVVVPAAMGTTNQVAPNTNEKGQAENRRAVVTLLENKGIGGR
jgi:outer membrane protein OmpA-like peptidoglycan-associated protein